MVCQLDEILLKTITISVQKTEIEHNFSGKYMTEKTDNGAAAVKVLLGNREKSINYL